MSGIINYFDNTGFEIIDRNTGKYDQTSPNLNIRDDLNHIHGKHQFVPEYNILHDELMAPYSVKYKNEALYSIEHSLLCSGYYQDLLIDITSDNNNKVSLKDFNKYLKLEGETFNNVQTNKPNNIKTNNIKTNNIKTNNIKTNNINTLTKKEDFINNNYGIYESYNTHTNQSKDNIQYPVYDNANKFYSQRQFTNNLKNMNKFQDTDEFYQEYQLLILDANNNLNVDVNSEDRIIKSGNSVQYRGRDVSNLLMFDNNTNNDETSESNNNDVIEEMEDIESENEQQSKYILSQRDTFISNNYELLPKFENGSSIFNDGYYYIKIPVIYKGGDFKVKGNNFLMSVELHEYPKQIFDFEISEQFVTDTSNHPVLFNSRLGMSMYNLHNWEKNDGFIMNGDVIDFVIKIDKNIPEAQKLGKNTLDCAIGGLNEFSRNCRINLSNYHFLIIYFKNYDFEFNKRSLGKTESYAFQKYPISVHPNERNFLNSIGADNIQILNRYVGRKIINNITFNEGSFFGLRKSDLPNIITDKIYGTINGLEVGNQPYFCGNMNDMASLKVGYDDKGITGIQGICRKNTVTPEVGTIDSDGFNSKIIPINNNKVIVGSRDYNKNYESGYNDIYRQDNNTSEGKPYLNKSDNTRLSNYIHEFIPYESKNKELVYNKNTSVGNSQDIYYTNQRKIIACRDSVNQRVVGFMASQGHDNRISDIGLLCDDIVPVPFKPEVKPKPVSNHVKPKLKPYRLKDENNIFIGINRIDKNNQISYQIIFSENPPLEDHRFKFFITYYTNSDSLYYITSAKYLIQNNENVLLTTTNIVPNSNFNLQKFGVNLLEKVSEKNLYQIKLSENEENKYTIKATFVLDLDKTYCKLVSRTSSKKLDCTKNITNGTNFTLEVVEADIPRPVKEIKTTMLQRTIKDPEDIDSKYTRSIDDLYEDAYERNKRLQNIENKLNKIII